MATEVRLCLKVLQMFSISVNEINAEKEDRGRKLQEIVSSYYLQYRRTAQVLFVHTLSALGQPLVHEHLAFGWSDVHM